MTQWLPPPHLASLPPQIWRRWRPRVDLAAMAAAENGSGGSGSLRPRLPRSAEMTEVASADGHSTPLLAGSGHGRRWRLWNCARFLVNLFFLTPFTVLMFLYLGSNWIWVICCGLWMICCVFGLTMWIKIGEDGRNTSQNPCVI